MFSIPNIFTQLEMTSQNGLFIFEEKKWLGQFSQKVEYALFKIKPFALFEFNKEPLVLFFDEPKSEEEFFTINEQCWNFNKAPIIFINYKNENLICNGFSFDHDAKLLSRLAGIKNLKDFSYWNIVTGQLWDEYQKSLKKENRVDFKLLKNIEEARDELINTLKLDKSITNKLIGRLIFARYLIDRKVSLDFKFEKKHNLSKENLPDLILDKGELYRFFNFLKTEFNGDLFPITKSENDVNSSHLDILHKLFSGSEIKSRQGSLFNIYNFDIIPVEFISNVYEYFLGKEKQESSKAFYTPPFLVDYILSQTVIPYFRKKDTPSCKVLDPACGSGIFLVETLRLIIAKFKTLNPDLKPSTKKYKNEIKKLLINNIFGIDLNKDALEIAVFSLYITLLDFFEEPKDIKNFRFPPLFGTNFFEGDFFKVNQDYNKVLEKKKLDFILGNPPWGKVEGSPYMEYISKREKKEEKKIAVSNKQIAQAFMVRVSDFCQRHTKCSLIIPSRVLYNLLAANFRRYFVNKFFIKEIFEISAVRKLVFANATEPAAILTYCFANDDETNENMVEHISLKPNPFFALFKSILIEKYDYKEVKQSYFKMYDWIWKVLVYGSVLDFYLVKKLKNKNLYSNTFSQILNDDNEEIIQSNGVTIGNKKEDTKDNALHLLGLPFIEINKTKKRKSGDLSRYYLRIRPNSFFDVPKVIRPRNPKLFKKTILLIRSGLDQNFNFVASISYDDVVFNNSVCGIRGENIPLLENLLGLINSSLSKYYIFITGSYTGIKQEKFLNDELDDFPVIYDKEIIQKVKTLLKLNKEKYSESKFNEDEIIQTEKELNSLIFELYKLNNIEQNLMDYAFNISIPIVRQGDSVKKRYKNFYPYKPLKQKSSELKKYTQIVLEYYNNNHKNKEDYLQADIYCTKHIVAINFKLLTTRPEKDIIWNDSDGNYIEFLASIAFSKVSSRLFIQKDLKGIRERSFYVIKPNQYKYWHPAIAHLDIIEFDNKMINQKLNSLNETIY